MNRMAILGLVVSASSAFAGDDHVFLYLQLNCESPPPIFESRTLSHPSSIGDSFFYPFGSVAAQVTRGRARCSAVTSSTTAFHESRSLSTGSFQESIVLDVPCHPELIGTPGTIRLRRPVVTTNGQAIRPSDGMAYARADVTMLVNGSQSYFAVAEYHPESDPSWTEVDLDDPTIVFGQVVHITGEVEVSTRTLRISEIPTSASVSAEIVWQGIEAIFDQNGVVVPCVPGCQFICGPFVSPPACPGDANSDGLTDAADLSVLLASFGAQTAPFSGANFNSDAIVDGADLSVLLSNFGCDVTP